MSGELRFVDPRSDEWVEMWSGLQKRMEGMFPGRKCDQVDRDEESGEEWQYMGTCVVTDIHAFRHRRHPADGKRIYIDIPGRMARRLAASRGRLVEDERRRFREEECGGVVGADGGVYSDADPGL